MKDSHQETLAIGEAVRKSGLTLHGTIPIRKARMGMVPFHPIANQKWVVAFRSGSDSSVYVQE